MDQPITTTKESSVTLSRRHVLGDLHASCDALRGSVPVYLDGEAREVLGHASEQDGKFADAISFFLSDEICKKLSSGYFTFSFEYEIAKPATKAIGRRVILTSIILTGRKNYVKPIPRQPVGL